MSKEVIAVERLFRSRHGYVQRAYCADRPQLNWGVRQHPLPSVLMAAIFEVISRNDGATMQLRADDRDYFIADLRGLNLSAQARVGTYMSAGLAELFAEMATSWRGWSGKKSWSSLEGELHLSAEADRTGHITLTVELREGMPSVWSVTLLLVLEAGQLESLARAARAFENSVLSAA